MSAAPSPLPRPEKVRERFNELKAEDAAKAVAYLYQLGLDHDYIHRADSGRNWRWETMSPYGRLELSINLSKPEKDPRAIAAALDAGDEPQDPSAPRCDLCWENEDYPGSPGHPPKPGLRIAALTLDGELWGFQYSPYAYFQEHCIALSREHRPMHMDLSTFRRLLDFVAQFPFYFIGSNAELPIVGGSILSHDHFQGGRHSFPMMEAPVTRKLALNAFPEVSVGLVRWPPTVLRLVSRDPARLSEAADHILRGWRAFSAPERSIIGARDGVVHSTVNPIARKKGADFILDLVLRNNLTTPEAPWGLYHPDPSLFHIKKENIGLIEIMGLAVLPARLAKELPQVQAILYEAATSALASPSGEPSPTRQGHVTTRDEAGPAADAPHPLPSQLTGSVKARLDADELTRAHRDWALDVLNRRALELAKEAASNDEGHGRAASDIPLGRVFQEELGQVFLKILEATNVFKFDGPDHTALDSFLESIGAREVRS